MKYLTSQPEVGKKYRIELNGTEIYDATVIEHEGGCWAKIRVDNVLPGEYAGFYSNGQEFDLKLSRYNLLEFDTQQ
ncbi:MAG: hypothetical protein OZ913_00755 [Ignavibacteriaceae bacterium]|jgi:hypothetical protein|nr:MAG: hypothetical protein UZ04_CHB001001400 [Chlorobi bacterium OLB4]MBV6398995.1 hypothetical protein [Ignavibacteria bacterium]MCC6886168.1 hypothetical protein [Ignavibacteriales bacterium]MDL1887783.1 hypothetical protein [Ignavibacteria bacterium CHB1]MEB2328817.1 hypothetical protein [Ignavibacteriaceae bacterium]